VHGTRNKYHCVLTIDHTEVVLVDTPGLHKSSQELNKRINQQAREGIDGAALNLLLIDLTKDVLEQFRDFKENIQRDLGPTIAVFTKSDRVENARELPLTMVYESAKQILPCLDSFFMISTKSGDNVHLLTGEICDRAQPGPHFYNGEVSNKPERFFATEYIREQAFSLLKDELPYELAVVIDEYKDVKDNDKKVRTAAHISASILVNRPSQRAIVVGSKGTMIKEIGTRARKKIEAMSDCDVDECWC